MNVLKNICLLLLLPATCCIAQDMPIGYWQSHLPYNTAVGLATDGNTIFTVCAEGFFTYAAGNGQINTYSKVEGMSDLGMACVAYDQATKTTVMAYANGNIDLFKDNTFYNIPDLKIKSIAGAKNIHHIYIEAGIAYLSTDIGVLVIDLANRVVLETYVFTISNQVVPILDYAADDTCFYAATVSGLFRARKADYNQLQNFSVWTNIDNTHSYKALASIKSRVYAANDSLVFYVQHNNRTLVYKSAQVINHIDAGLNSLIISEYTGANFSGDIKIIDSTNQLSDSFHIGGQPVQAIQLLNGTYWIADAFNGLCKRTGTNEVGTFIPEGPTDHNSFDIYAYNRNVWIAHGGYNDLHVSNNSGSGISNLTNDKWIAYRQFEYAPFEDSMKDFVAITKDKNTGTVYAGSFQSGLFWLNTDGSYKILKQNSILDQSSTNHGLYQVAGLGFDHENNLWVSMLGSKHELLAKTPAGDWYKFSVSVVPPSSYNFDAGPLIVDQNDQIWYASSFGGGVVVYNYNGTLSNPNDDISRLFVQGVGQGNLPSNKVNCLAEDNNGDIWIGTDNGIGIVSCAGSIAYSTQHCDATIPIVQYDKYANYLFVGENVRSVAVDGGNRKWVGTDNGIWLLSSDAAKIIFHFTVDNSPLPSNHIKKITIDPVTGDVYIGTDFGLICYHGSAVAGGTTNSNVITYPNPVSSTYKGTIAIKGLVTNADVRITDITGQLVYRTTALGGQAIWNGMDYSGHRPQTGVYLIFVSNIDGSQTYAGKMVFIQ